MYSQGNIIPLAGNSKNIVNIADTVNSVNYGGIVNPVTGSILMNITV